ncbi:FliH/SctL family protein [Butyrivibrio sp. MB2005]|uniref:FliH/SctL family protein n=1 Tax=Butyrivibrio sp. MB2005 TaxID=1280678 RepID=UPI00047BE1AE|nr:FliH/SctL family protein [Butyrivibrio sp. MB2005]
MIWLSNSSNLFKAGWIMVDESEKRIIDNNELANKKIEAHQEEEARRLLAAKQENGEDVVFDGFSDGFSEGIGYDQIDAFDDSQNIIGAGSPEFMEGMDGEGFDPMMTEMPDMSQMSEEVMPDDGMQNQFQDGYFDESQGMSDEDMNLGMEMEEPPASEMIPEEPQFNLDEIQAQIDEQLRMADEQAKQIVADAQAQAEEIRNQAQEEGKAAGYEEGYQQGIAEAEQLKADAQAEIEEEKNKLQADFQQLINTIEPDMVDALTSVYEHVFNVEFKDNKDIILHLIRTTLSKMDSGISIILHISSDDYDLVSDEKPSLEEAMASPNSTLEIIEDPLLKENECIIESEGGVFDCSLGVELSELARKLKLLSYDRSKR